MNITKLKKEQDFINIKKDDTIIVKWNEYWCKHHFNKKDKYHKSIQLYRIVENKKSHNEIICSMTKNRNNHYFNWKMYLNNTSQALEVYKVE